MTTVKILYETVVSATVMKREADARVEGDKAMLQSDIGLAADAESARALASQDLLNRTPEGIVYPVSSGLAILKQHGELTTLTIGDPEADLDTGPASIA